MKIVVIVRTRNEKNNIKRFCKSYDWADEILVADGGSTDGTVKLACKFPNVRVRPFLERTQMDNGLWRNPAGEHINFLIEWAEELDADWVIFDDCDCVPNKLLKSDARLILESTTKSYAHVVRLYLYREGTHFPNLAQPEGEGIWTASLWAWRLDTGLRFKTNPVNHTHERKTNATNDEKLNLMPPYCLLHRSWPTEEEENKKIEFYTKSGQHPGTKRPQQAFGKLAPLPEWAI